ncbi:formate dehydrogenase major subunit/formate dehydrogenase alpha subunit [Desulfocicer vacuolatum DSM 3385]|nr:formate dehydrogenase major subunit/formate dehydrogenase alpha subunit [Desulfocicer vacuolatum DSM 3385]
MTNSIEEFETHSKVIFVIGSNTTACHPLIASRIIKAKENGAKLIVADPRNIQLSRYADFTVHQRLGSDVALLNGMMHIIIKNNWHDQAYIEQRCEDFEQLKETLHTYTPTMVEAITGIAKKDITKMAELYATQSPAALLYAMGITQHTTGVDNVKSCCNLAMLCGNVGVAGGGVNPLRGQNNVQGACDMGGLPNVFTGYQPVADPKAREKFSQAWDCELSDTPGMTITDMISAIEEGKIKGLYVIGENPKLSDPDKNHLDNAFKKLDFLITEDIFLTESAQIADVVFASASLGEREGTFTNTERRCMLTRKAVEPVGNALPDWEIISRFSTALGYEMNYDCPSDIFNEMTSLTKSYQGMSYQRLGIDGLQWPCPTPEHPGTPYLHKNIFTRGKGKFHAIDYKDPAELTCEDYPMLMTTGRMFAHFHTGTMTRVSTSLDSEQKTGYVEINPKDARRLNINTDDMILLTSRRGKIEAPARITDSVPPNNIFLPIHFGENPTNVLTSSTAFDPIAKIPEFKVGAVKIEKLIA